MIPELDTGRAKMFHPVHSRDQDAWYPSNEAATTASLISNTWEDILCLETLRGKVKDDYTNRLLFKYMLVELKSFFDRMDQLQPIVFKYLTSGSTSSIEDVATGNAGKIRDLYKQYHSLRGALEKELSEVRNEIGAHRSFLQLSEVTKLWDKLNPEKYLNLFKIVPELFDYLVKLDIYDWTRIPDPGVIEICCSGLENEFSEIFKNKESSGTDQMSASTP
jgi:hypothetical protein